MNAFLPMLTIPELPERDLLPTCTPPKYTSTKNHHPTLPRFDPILSSYWPNKTSPQSLTTGQGFKHGRRDVGKANSTNGYRYSHSDAHFNSGVSYKPTVAGTSCAECGMGGINDCCGFGMRFNCDVW